MAWRIFRTVLVGAVVSAALLIAFPPTGLLKDHLAATIGTTLGRKVTIGDLRLSVPLKLERPRLNVELDQVTIANPEGMPVRDLFTGPTVKTTVDLLPLLKGRVRMEALAFVQPTLALEEDAAGNRNWVFAASQRPAATATASAPVSDFTLPPAITIDNGAATYQSSLTGSKAAASAITSVQTLDAVSGAVTSKGQLAAGGETVTFDVALGDYSALTTVKTTTLVARMDARPLTASISGDASFSTMAEFKGNVVASTPSLVSLAQWAGSDATASGEPLRTSLEGKIAAAGDVIAFTETDVMVNTTSGRFDGTLDLAGERPKIAGAISSDHIDLQRLAGTARRPSLAPEAIQEDFEPLVRPSWEQLLNDLNTLEAGPQAAAVAEAAPSAAVSSSSGWSDQPFNLKSLRTVDMDVEIRAAEISYGQLDLKQGRVKAGLTDGVLDATIEELAVGEGSAKGTINIDSRASPPRAKVALNLSKVAAEPIVTELTGKPLLSGTSDVVINASAAGQNQAQLTSTLDGKAHFQMGRGALRGFDVRRMIFEWWKSWKFDLAMKTGFERLDAQYDIKKGIMRSEPGFSMGGPEVEINSTGSVNVPARKLNQEIRVKAIPPPTAFPIPVRISGDWSKPSVGIDWGGLFSSAPGLGGPQALAASPEPAPANVQAAIRRVLAADIPPERLTPEARQMLQWLLPAEGAAPESSTPEGTTP
ncbi:AsmA family protein [Hyphomicrobium sp.]|uniref:AsmA family protein n=1 Tax=Hyphomicrobium sp. TaxID=82 RepID=UPI003F71444D